MVFNIIYRTVRITRNNPDMSHTVILNTIKRLTVLEENAYD